MKKMLLIILLILIVTNVYKINEQNIIIPDSSIRLRVIPNSNNPKDINIKEKIKTYLENNIYTLLTDNVDIEQAREVIKESIPNIKENIDTIKKENNYNIPYKINYGYNYFPTKQYKGINYKEGYYESLVISIGEGKGDNWWCSLFPNFCLIDKKEKHEYKIYIKELIKKYSKKNIKE